ncbi:MAG: hypothetical protein U0M02_14055 [Acutalibacteraceae bacterium]|nr:hypothetical protein [Acutalibacteraceae bacterium]
MYTMVVIDVQNPNALISMAYVSENSGNPFAVFCEFIKYCLFTNPKDYMSIAEIKAAVSEEFGLFLPHNVLLNCFSILNNEGSIKHYKNSIRREGIFDTEKFNDIRTTFRKNESTLVNELITYVGKYGLSWSEDFARKQLIKVLDGDGLAYDIFSHKSDNVFTPDSMETGDITEDTITDIDDSNCVDESENQSLFSYSFLVSKFVEELLTSSSVLKDYLIKVCEGLMISVGAYQLPSEGVQKVAPQIKGTTFYFDTRLLLRYIGCANDAAVKATQELVSMIQSKGGIIAYFPHTLQEMESAFSDAILCLTNGIPIKDHEMRMYATNINYQSSVISAKKASLTKELESSGIVLRQLQYHNDSDRIHFGFNCDDFSTYMKNKLNWENRTIENDALSIWETHMCRNGSYHDYCGTQNRLCVFVTSNAKLIEVALGYRKDRPNLTSISGWSVNRLPVITDVRLTCRLWDPAAQIERVSLLRLSANIVAAQRPTQLYINKIRALATELQNNVPEYSNICLSEYFDDEITNRIFEKTEGREENLTIDTFASTINEISEMKAKEQEELTKKEALEKAELKAILEKQETDIISGAVDSFKNRMGISKIFLYLGLYWSEFVAVLFVGISSLISYFIGNWHVSLLCIIPIALWIIERFFASNFILKKLLNKMLPIAEKNFKEKIKRQLKPAEKQYEEIIIQKVMQQTNVLEKCKKHLK